MSNAKKSRFVFISSYGSISAAKIQTKCRSIMDKTIILHGQNRSKQFAKLFSRLENSISRLENIFPRLENNISRRGNSPKGARSAVLKASRSEM